MAALARGSTEWPSLVHPTASTAHFNIERLSPSITFDSLLRTEVIQNLNLPHSINWHHQFTGLAVVPGVLPRHLPLFCTA